MTSLNDNPHSSLRGFPASSSGRPPDARHPTGVYLKRTGPFHGMRVVSDRTFAGFSPIILGNYQQV